MTGWYDNLVHEGFRQLVGWRAGARSAESRRLTRLLVGPWSHQNLGSAAPFGAIEFGGAAAMDLVDEQLRWFDRRLKDVDNGIDEEPPIRLFVMGANTWRGEHEWPLARTRFTRFFLSSSGRANSLHGTGRLSLTAPRDDPPDRYAYHPDDPTPTLGGPFMLLTNSGPGDRRPVERRDDVLNTGHVPGLDAVMRPAEQTIFHDASRPSHLTLPVIPP